MHAFLWNPSAEDTFSHCVGWLLESGLRKEERSNTRHILAAAGTSPARGWKPCQSVSSRLLDCGSTSFLDFCSRQHGIPKQRLHLSRARLSRASSLCVCVCVCVCV